MIDRCGVDAHELMVLAIRVFEFGKRVEPFFLEQLIEMRLSDDDGRIGSEVDPGGDDRQADSEIDPDENDAKIDELLSPDLYADSQGWAWMAYTALSKTDLPKSKLMFGLQLCEFPSASQILDALGVYWFFEAARLSNAGDGRALDVLFESSGAFELARVADANDEAEEWTRGDHAYARHLLGKHAASARHAEDYETAERIQAWYVENHHHYRSMDAAADAVTGLEPVAFRTARKHIGAAAKKLRSARKE
ncbi:hypothetical protein [Thauera aromatica]|uniref:Uncharacterized protein n=1 Tax=Thauera aromatica K172 TaxID=44139 RepID=A0A2R4BJV2_THAAR|nr:hypothetical protein [Thauera aromatica]AVR87522.1 hypothetical protein Tharo_0579 [Thauera aromatica K172]